MPKYPNVTVNFYGIDSNAFVLMGIVGKELRRAGIPQAEITEFNQTCMNAGSYDELLQEIMKTVEVCFEEP